MNVPQAQAQNRLSHGINPGRDSSEDFSLSKNPKNSQNKPKQEGSLEKKITKGTFITMLGVGLILDIVGLLPLVGWFVSSITLIVIYDILGVKFHIKNILKFGSCDIVKLIPGLSLVPAFVLSVVLNLGPMVEGIEKTIPGGEQLAHTVQKAMATTKKI